MESPEPSKETARRDTIREKHTDSVGSKGLGTSVSLAGGGGGEKGGGTPQNKDPRNERSFTY